MATQRHKYIVDFFDVSILIPVDAGDVEEFKKNLVINHRYLMQNGIEVILLFTGDPDMVMGLTDEFPFLNWKIILTNAGAAAKPTVKLNTGLHYAAHRYVLVMGVSTVLASDSIYEMRYAVYHYPGSFVTVPCHDPLEYRLLMAERAILQTIGGFSELEDDRLNNVNIQRRLELAGQDKIALVSLSPLAAPSSPSADPSPPSGAPSSPSAAPSSPSAAPSAAVPSEVLFPRLPWVAYPDARHPAAAPDSMIVFDWTRHKSPRAVNLVLEKFEKVTLKDQRIFQPQYGIICLIQIHNEAAHIPAVLSHLDGLCDGIILLDDGSSDGSYENAGSEKLLIKVQTANKGIFNDLGNRNLLLDLAYLFRAEWFFFIDADERFDTRYANLRQVAQTKDIDTVAFRLVHLWDADRRYRKDFPEGNKGVISRNRMFRNKGYLQVTSEREIHFCATPFKHKRLRSPILLLHYGLIDETARMKKFQAYFFQDAGGKKQGYAYDFLLDKDIEWGNVEDLEFPSR